MLLFRVISFSIFFLSVNLLAAQYQKLLDSAKKAIVEQEYAHAISYYKDAIQAAPNQNYPALRILECSIYSKDIYAYKDALFHLEKNNYPIPMAYYLTFAELAEAQNNNAEALVMLNKAEKKYNSARKVLLAKADLYGKMHNSSEKMAVLNRLLMRDNDDAAVIYRLSDAYFFSNPTKSIDFCKRLLHEPYYVDYALVTLGKLYLNRYEKTKQKEDLSKAYSYYKTYANIYPQDATIKKILKGLEPLK